MSELQIPIGIRTAQVVGITSAAYLSGYISSFTFISVPALAKLPPSVKTQQWATLYHIGAKSAPFIAIASSLAFSYLAARIPRVPELFRHTPFDTTRLLYLYTASAILVPTIVPWTIGIMKPTNDKIFGKAAEYSKSGSDEAKEDQELDQLLKSWMTLNLVRSLFPAAAAVVGLWAVIS